MRRTVSRALASIVLLTVAAGAGLSYGQSRRSGSATQIDHPTALVLPPLTFTSPRAADYRVALANGLVLYVVPNDQFRLVSIRAMARGGSLSDPSDRVGLARQVARFLGEAGVGDLSPSEVKEFLSRSGGELSVSADEAAMTLDLSIPSEEARRAVHVISGLLEAPRFSEDALAHERNVATTTVFGGGLPEVEVRSRFNSILYKDHPLSRAVKRGLLATLTVADLQRHHARLFQPSNIVLMVAGNFEKAAMLEWWRQELASWTPAHSELPPISTDIRAPERAIHLIHRPGLQQAFSHMGHRGIRMSDPDYFAVQVMNWILTGAKVYAGIGAFSARLWFELRTNRGISSMGYGEFWDTFHYPAPFVLYWKGREEKTGEALSVILKEIARIRTEPVTPLELRTAKNFYLHGLPAKFYTAEATARTLGQLEFDRAPLDFYDRFQSEIAKVTEGDVLRAARTHLRPDELFTVIVGDADRIQEAARLSGISLESFAPVQIVRQ